MIERTLKAGEVLEREVITNTKLTLTEPGSGLRYCTLGDCDFGTSGTRDLPDDERPFVSNCLLISGGKTLGELWDMAATADTAGHLALPQQEG